MGSQKWFHHQQRAAQRRQKLLLLQQQQPAKKQRRQPELQQPLLQQELARDTERAWAYWKSFAVPVAAGEHTMTVKNAGTGTMWSGYELRNFRHREGPDLDVMGMQ